MEECRFLKTRTVYRRVAWVASLLALSLVLYFEARPFDRIFISIGVAKFLAVSWVVIKDLCQINFYDSMDG